MFEKIRKPFRAKNIISYIIFAVICIVFVFIGVPTRQMSSFGGAAIIVNDQVITWSEYQNYLEILQNQASAKQESNLEAQRQIRQQAIDTLLNAELMVQEAEANGIYSANKSVRDRIVLLDFLKEDGSFSREKYYAFLQARRWSASYFESRVKRELQTTRLRRLFQHTFFVPKAETQQNQALSLFKSRVHFISFPSQNLSETEKQALTKWVQQGDIDALKQMMQEKKWEWEQSEEFDLSRRKLPGLPADDRLLEAVIHKAAQGGLIGHIFRIKDRSYLLKVIPFNKQKSKKIPEQASVSSFADKLMGQMFFLTWIQSVRAGAKLKWNPRLEQAL